MSKPTVTDLDKSLKCLVSWQRFALHLPGIKQSDINELKRDSKHDDVADQKVALYEKWLRVYPDASWGDVISALETVGENSIAVKLQKKFATTVQQKPSKKNKDRHKRIDNIKARINKQTLEDIDTQSNDKVVVVKGAEAQAEGVKKMSILVVGKTGSGKSTFINSVFGKKVATERRGVTAQAHNVLELHQRTIAGIDISFYDTRGLCDPNVSNQEFVSQLSNYETLQIDLVLICIKITERIDEGTIAAINDISSVFGDKFWKHSIFLLTFSNKYEQELIEDDDEIDEKVLAECVQDEVRAVAELLSKKVGLQRQVNELKLVEEEVFYKIPFVNVGRIRKGREESDKRLSTSDNWVNDVLHCCIRRCSEQIRPSMIRVAAECVGLTVVGVAVGSVLSAGIGAAIGGVVGTIFFPGVGTVSSAVIGAQWGVGIATVASTALSLVPLSTLGEYFGKGKLGIKKK